MKLLNIYILSIFIYMAVFISVAKICELQIRENGWLNNVPYCENPLFLLFCMCAVPIIRVLNIAIVIYASTHTKEEFEAWQHKIQQEIENEERELEELKRECDELKCIYDYLKNNPEDNE